MGHHHHHESHDAADIALDRRYVITIVLNATIAIGEAIAGMFSGSLALLADAAHNLGDVAAIVLALVARKLGRRPPTARHTYGFRRIEVMGALVNALLLVGITVLIGREAVERLMQPQPVAQGLMLLFGTLALLANLGSVWLLKHHDAEDVNTRSAMLHLIQDAVASLAVIVAAAFARTSFGPLLDPAVALLVSLVVLRASVSLVSETLSTFLEGAPRDIDIARIADSVATTFPPVCLHHIHVWSISPKQRLLTAHVALGSEMQGREIEQLLVRIKAHLADQWRIDHSTLEPEVSGCGDSGLLGKWDCSPNLGCCDQHEMEHSQGLSSGRGHRHAHSDS